MTNIKLIEKNGKKPGKTVVLLAGIHGNEVCGVKAFDELIPKIEIESGKVIFIYANLEAIEKNKRQIEYNLNRCFLKEQTKIMAESLEGKTAKEIIPYLERADLMLDLHASFTKDSIPFVICDEKQLGNANIFDSKIVSYNWDPFEPGSTDYYMNLQNKPGFCFECGYFGDKKSFERAKNAVLDFLIFSGNISGALFKKNNQRIIRIKGIYKNTIGSFKKIEYKPDFWIAEKNSKIGTDGEKDVFINAGEIILFLVDNEKLNEECFLVAEETLINKQNLTKNKKEEKQNGI